MVLYGGKSRNMSNKYDSRIMDVKCFRVITQASKGFQIPLIILKCQ